MLHTVFFVVSFVFGTYHSVFQKTNEVEFIVMREMSCDAPTTVIGFSECAAVSQSYVAVSSCGCLVVVVVVVLSISKCPNERIRFFSPLGK